MREVVSQDNTRLTHHLYVYKCGDQYTPRFLTQQAMILINGLTAGNASGALIHFTVPVERQNVARARYLALSAASQLMPTIDEGLP